MPPTPLQSIVSADDRMRRGESGEGGLRQLQAAVSAAATRVNGAWVAGSPEGTLLVPARRVQTGFTRFLGYWEKRNISCQERGERRRDNRNESENE